MVGLDRKRTTTLVAVIAVAGGLGLVAATGDVGRREVDAADVGTRSSAALAGALLGAIAVLVGVVVARRFRQRIGRPTLGLLLLAGSVVGGASAVDMTNLDPPPADTTVDGGPASADGQQDPLGPGARPQSSDDDRRGLPIDVDAEGTVILLIALGLLIAAIVFFGRRTELRAVAHAGVYLRSDLEPANPLGASDDVSDRRVGEALLASLEALDASGSPAERIRAAYGTMLLRFDEIGLGRHPAEPPGAYVGRCLRSRPLPQDHVERLLGLFELARFSRRPLSETDVESARTALRGTADATSSVRS
jgi:hypothetical protein